MNNMKHMLELYRQKRFQWEIEGVCLKVDSNEVFLKKRRNHHYLTCTCTSSGTTGNFSICRHKEFFMLFPFLKSYTEKIDAIKINYSNARMIRLDVNPHQVLDDLNKLKRFEFE